MTSMAGKHDSKTAVKWLVRSGEEKSRDKLFAWRGRSVAEHYEALRAACALANAQLAGHIHRERVRETEREPARAGNKTWYDLIAERAPKRDA